MILIDSVSSSLRTLESNVSSLKVTINYSKDKWNDRVSESYCSYVNRLDSSVYSLNNISKNLENIYNEVEKTDSETIISRINGFERLVDSL